MWRKLFQDHLGEIVCLLKALTENEINTAITDPESIPGSGNHNSHEAGPWCFSLCTVSRPHVQHVQLICLFLISTRSCSCVRHLFSRWTFAVKRNKALTSILQLPSVFIGIHSGAMQRQVQNQSISTHNEELVPVVGLQH